MLAVDTDEFSKVSIVVHEFLVSSHLCDGALVQRQDQVTLRQESHTMSH